MTTPWLGAEDQVTAATGKTGPLRTYRCEASIHTVRAACFIDNTV